MIVLKQNNKYLSIHKETGNYELSSEINDSTKKFELICDAIKFAEKLEPKFNLTVEQL